ncbi:hypothetical protein DHD32_21775 [Arenibacter sp. TNZ]|uniref:O-antigen ligase family protein n=1 Tax=Arenibacter TaxID=178469 RepID=UPI000CD410CA|nr:MULTISPECIES: O-antigen ligase family protein [Arenibacter]MCM4174101.1 hypothetical protein [Arenibacter sp. TNZ]
MEKYLRFEYFFSLMVLIWEPFQRFILKVDGAGYSITLLCIILLSILIRKKSFYKIAFNKPLIIWLLWLIYTFINALINGYGDDIPILSFFTNIFAPLLLMIVITLEFKRDDKKLLNILIMGLYLAIILILLFETETEHGRTGGELNSNTIGTMATVLCMLLYLKYYKHQLKALWFIILISLPIFTIISTGSRTAFGGLALLLGLHFFINRSRNVLITISKIVLPALILILAFNYLLENTGLGERILSTTEQSEGMDFETGNPILDKFGDRGIFYYRGWEVFIEQPLTGIGLGNFKDYNENKLAQHSEYMIQLTELGLIGFTLFFLFYLSIFKNLFRIKNILINKRENELFIGYVLIILLMITATRMYQVGYFFAIIGVTIGYFTKQKFLIQRVKIKN